MALGTPTLGTVAYSTAGGTTVAPTYPTGITSTDVLILIVGQKPSTANGGTVTTPTGWTLQRSLTGAGGYGATLAADTGNTNLFIYTKNTVTGTETGTLSVTVGTNNICWAGIIRISSSGGTITYGSSTAQRTTAPTATMALTLAANPDIGVFDRAVWAMVVPTDVSSGASFSVPTLAATGATFAAGVELAEPFSALGNQIGGYIAYAVPTGGASTVAPTVTVTTAGTRTNLRGPLVLLRVRERIALSTTETTSTSDSYLAVGPVSRATTETGAAADSVARLFSPQVVQGLIDQNPLNFYALNANGVYSSARTESGTAADSSTGLLQIATSRAEAGSVADAAVSGLLLPNATAETAAASDSSTTSQVRAGAVTETGAASDSSTGLGALVASAAESGSAADSSTGPRTRAGAAPETLTTTDSVQTLFSPRGANGLINTDPLNLYVLNGNAAVIVVNEVASATETSSVVAVRLGNLTETGSLADSSVGSRVYSASASESGSAADAATATPTLARTAAETLSSVDSSSTTMARAGAAVESGSAADSSTRNLARSSAAADSLAATDITQTLFSPRGANGLINTDVLNLFPLNGNSSIYIVGENLVAADTSVSATGNASIAVDTLSASDAATVSRITSSAAAETLTATDAPVALFSPRAGTGLIDTDVLNLLPLNGAGTRVFRYESVTATDSASSLILNVAAVSDTLSAADSATGTMPLTAAVAETLTATDAPVALFSPRAGTGLIDTDVLNLLPLNGTGTGLFVTEVLSAADTSTRSGVQNVAIAESASAADSSGLLYSPLKITGLINSDVLNLLPLNGSGGAEFVYETLAATDSAARSGVQLASVSENGSAADSATYSGVQNVSVAESMSATDASTSAIPAAAQRGLINTDVLNLLPLNGSGGDRSFVSEALSATDSATRSGTQTVSIAESAAATDSVVLLFSPAAIRGLINTDVLNLLPLNGAGGESAFVYESSSVADSSIRTSSQTLVLTETLTATDTSVGQTPAGYSVSVIEPSATPQGLLGSDVLNRLALNGVSDAYQQSGIRETIAGGFVLAASAQEVVSAVDSLTVAPQAQHGLINTDPLNTYVLNGSATQFFVRETLSITDSASSGGTFSLSVSEPPRSGFGLFNTDPLNRLRLNNNLAAYDVGLIDTAVGGFVLAAAASDTLNLTDSASLAARPDTGLINTDALNLLPLNGNGPNQFIYETLAAADASSVKGLQNVAVYEPPLLGFGLLGTSPLNVFPANGSTNLFLSTSLVDLTSVSVSYAVSVSENLPFLTDVLYPNFTNASRGLINTDVLNLLPLNGNSELFSTLETLSAADSAVAAVQSVPLPNRSGLINTDVLNLLPLNGTGGLTVVAEGISAVDSLSVIGQYSIQYGESLSLQDSFSTIVPTPGQVNLYNTDPLDVWPLNGSGPLIFGVGVIETGSFADLAGTQMTAVASRPEVLTATDSLALSFAVFVTDTLAVAADQVTFVIYFSSRQESVSPADSSLQDYFALNAQPLADVKVAHLTGDPFPGYIYAVVTDTGTTGPQPVEAYQIYASARSQAIYATAFETGIEIHSELNPMELP